MEIFKPNNWFAICLIVIAIGILSLIGCATDPVEMQSRKLHQKWVRGEISEEQYQAKSKEIAMQKELYWKKVRGEISEEQYDKKLKDIRQEQPWGGNIGQGTLPDSEQDPDDEFPPRCFDSHKF